MIQNYRNIKRGSVQIWHAARIIRKALKGVKKGFFVSQQSPNNKIFRLVLPTLLELHSCNCIDLMNLIIVALYNNDRIATKE